MKLSSEEKNYIEKISSICGHDESVVKDVFNSAFIAMVLEIFSGNNEVILPYLWKVKVKYSKKLIAGGYNLKEAYEIETLPCLYDAMVKMYSDDPSELEKLIEKRLAKFISDTLDMDAK